MKFLLDESAEFRLATFLEGEGHDAKTIARDFQHSLSDEEVLAIALREQRILITNDRDFGELIVRRRLEHAGVIFFRLRDQAVELKIEWLRTIIAQHGDQVDQFLVVSDRGIRVRRAATPEP